MAPQILGLSTCADTIIGDELQRGISGGQKKRTTIGKYFTLELASLLLDTPQKANIICFDTSLTDTCYAQKIHKM
jgi:ABC-type nitrate/sulfonate/bicarbonate transport system ATPase subunit